MDGRPLTQVAEAVIEQLDSEGGEARIILDPPELGEIVIKLHARGEHVSIEVVAQRPEAIQMLRDGSPSLQALLQERGLDLSTAQFTLSQHGRQGGSQGDEQAAANNNSGFAPLLGFDEPDDAATRNHNRLRAAYNPDGAHLYRV
jgi:flagellar hook-length control protein FliK